MIEDSIEAVAFDLDETLIVPGRDRTVLLREACRAAGVDPIDRAAYLEAHDDTPAADIDRTRAPIFERLRPGSGEAIADAYCAAMADAVSVVPGARAAIDLARDRGSRVGICTDGPVRAQRAKLEAADLAGVADATLITGEIDARKPDRAVFETLCDRLGVDPDATLFVGDDPDRDVSGASRVGLQTVQVATEAPVSPAADRVTDRSALEETLAAVLDATGEP